MPVSGLQEGVSEVVRSGVSLPSRERRQTLLLSDLQEGIQTTLPSDETRETMPLEESSPNARRL